MFVASASLSLRKSADYKRLIDTFFVIFGLYLRHRLNQGCLRTNHPHISTLLGEETVVPFETEVLLLPLLSVTVSFIPINTYKFVFSLRLLRRTKTQFYK
jgi:hypothetical protein